MPAKRLAATDTYFRLGFPKRLAIRAMICRVDSKLGIARRDFRCGVDAIGKPKTSSNLGNPGARHKQFKGSGLKTARGSRFRFGSSGERDDIAGQHMALTRGLATFVQGERGAFDGSASMSSRLVGVRLSRCIVAKTKASRAERRSLF